MLRKDLLWWLKGKDPKSVIPAVVSEALARMLPLTPHSSLHTHSSLMAHNSKQKAVKMSFFHKMKLVHSSPPEI